METQKDQPFFYSDFQKRTLPGTRFQLPAYQNILHETLHVCHVGHAFGKLSSDFATGNDHYVQDFLVDQSQSTGGGAAMHFSIQLDLTGAQEYQYIIKPACKHKFELTLPEDVPQVYFSIWLGRQTPSPGGYFDAIPASVEFVNLAGSAPTLTFNNFFITHGYNGAILFEIEGYFTGNASFEKIILHGEYGSRDFDPGSKWYTPLSYAVPYGTRDIYPLCETFALFTYDTNKKHDPGKMIKIIE